MWLMSPVLSVVCTPNMSHVISLDTMGTLRVWSVNDATLVSISKLVCLILSYLFAVLGSCEAQSDVCHSITSSYCLPHPCLFPPFLLSTEQLRNGIIASSLQLSRRGHSRRGFRDLPAPRLFRNHRQPQWQQLSPQRIQHWHVLLLLVVVRCLVLDPGRSE